MRRRLVTLALASTSLVAVAFLVPLAMLVSDLATDRAVRPAELAARSLAPTAALVDEDTLVDVLAATSADLDGSASVVLPDGRVLGDAVRVDASTELVRREQVAVQVPTVDGRRILVPVVTADGVVVVDVRVAVDRRGVLVAWAALGVLGVVLVGGATALADKLASDTVAAARALEVTAERLSAGDLEASAGVERPSDLARVSGALDQLAGRIAVLLTEVREEAADLSHGLRTPATALRLDIEALPASGGRDRLVEDLNALDAAISSVIDEARAPVRAGAGEGADLAARVVERVAFWQGLAEDEGRAITVVAPSHPTPTALPSGEVDTVLDVLLDNAFRHTPTGTSVMVVVVAEPTSVELSVSDDGPGFPPGVDVATRGRSGAGGSGLGLDIVRRSVERVGGRVLLGAGSDGRGAEVRCVLPRQA